MRHFFASPGEFLESLVNWEKTAQRKKRADLEAARRDSESLGREDFRRDLLFIIDAGLTDRGGRENCVRYADSVYSESEREEIAGYSGGRWITGEELFLAASSFRRYQTFFYGERSDAERELLAYLMASPRPVGPSAILKAFPRKAGERTAAALHACLLGGIAVLSWNERALTVEIGIWPHVCPEINEDWRQAVELRPREGAAEEAPSELMRGIEAVLTNAAFGGLRLRENGKDLYSKDLRRIAAEWPAPRSPGLPAAPERERTARAISLLLRHGFLRRVEGAGGPPRLEIFGAGLGWLRKKPGERLRILAEMLRDAADSLGRTALETLGRLLNSGEAFALDDIIDYAVNKENPLLAAGNLPYAEAFGAWKKAVENGVYSYLLPLGGLKIGEAEGSCLAALSPSGFALLGGRGDYPDGETPERLIHIRRDGRIFLKRPDSSASRKLGRFCEEESVRDGPGQYFRVTKKSTARAAAEGLPVDAILFVLEELSSGGVPPALAARIAEWHRSARRADVFPGTVLECGGAAAAKGAAALFEGRARIIGGRFVLLETESLPNDFLARCRAEGIIVTDRRNPASRSSPG